MRQFLGNRLEQFVKTQEVDTSGQTIKVAGPLSDAFTVALNKALKKDPSEDITPVVESFTDPNVVADYLVEQAKSRKANGNPLTVYAFDRNSLDAEHTIEATTLATQTEPEDFYLAELPSANASLESYNKQHNRHVHCLEALVNRLGATYLKG